MPIHSSRSAVLGGLRRSYFSHEQLPTARPSHCGVSWRRKWGSEREGNDSRPHGRLWTVSVQVWPAQNPGSFHDTALEKEAEVPRLIRGFACVAQKLHENKTYEARSSQ